MRVAINGFGRIGRLVFRIMNESDEFDIVAVNSSKDAEHLTYLLKYDTCHRRYLDEEVSHDESHIIVGNKKTLVISEADPEKLPWKDLDIDMVFECTGKFTSEEDANKHIVAGAKKVIISAPSKGNVKTIVYGVNENSFNINLSNDNFINNNGNFMPNNSFLNNINNSIYNQNNNNLKDLKEKPNKDAESSLLNNNENNNEVKVLKNHKAVYVNSYLLNSPSSSKKLKKLNKIAFIGKSKRSSRYRGVSRNGNQWQVLIMLKRGKSYVGSYTSEEFAARIYDILAIKYRGIKARTNFKYSSEQIKTILETDIDIKSKDIYDFIEKIAS